jgi:hypothetical protein
LNGFHAVRFRFILSGFYIKREGSYRITHRKIFLRGAFFPLKAPAAVADGRKRRENPDSPEEPDPKKKPGAATGIAVIFTKTEETPGRFLLHKFLFYDKIKLSLRINPAWPVLIRPSNRQERVVHE